VVYTLRYVLSADQVIGMHVASTDEITNVSLAVEKENKKGHKLKRKINGEEDIASYPISYFFGGNPNCF
jgi:hypothetical protein